MDYITPSPIVGIGVIGWKPSYCHERSGCNPKPMNPKGSSTTSRRRGGQLMNRPESRDDWIVAN